MNHRDDASHGRRGSSGTDDHPVGPSKRRMDVDSAYDAPRGGGGSSSSSQNFGFGFAPAQHHPAHLQYAPAYAYNPTQPGMPVMSAQPVPNMGPTEQAYQQLAVAYQQLVESRSKEATVGRELLDSKAKELELRGRIRDRDWTIQELESKVDALRRERDGLVNDLSDVESEISDVRKELDALKLQNSQLHQHSASHPSMSRGRGRGFNRVSDGGWMGAGRGRGTAGASTIQMAAPPGPPAHIVPNPAPAPEPMMAPPGAGAHPATVDLGPGPPTTVTAPPTGPLTAEPMEVDEDLAHMTPQEREMHRIYALRGRRDIDLENSAQPRSAWYRWWVSQSAMTTAEAYAVLDDDEDDHDIVQDGVNPILPDPILAWGRNMTAATEQKVRNKAAARRGQVPLEPLPPNDNPAFGRWAGTTISSVVQAHNLRWFAVVEFDEDAVRFYKHILGIYTNGARYRPPGVRYLQTSIMSDSKYINERRGMHRPPNAPRDWLGPYPASTASRRDVFTFFRCVTVDKWPRGLRLASGAHPSGDGFGVPHEDDTYALFLLWHLIPSRPASNPAHVHDSRIRELVIELFSIPGWYRWIVEIGEYHLRLVEPACRYPFLPGDTSHVHIAAWFCTHGVGLDGPIIASIERWARAWRNSELRRGTLDTSPWPAHPISFEDVTSADHILPVTKYDELAWGERPEELHSTNLEDAEELIDAD